MLVIRERESMRMWEWLKRWDDPNTSSVEVFLAVSAEHQGEAQTEQHEENQ